MAQGAEPTNIQLCRSAHTHTQTKTHTHTALQRRAQDMPHVRACARVTLFDFVCVYVCVCVCVLCHGLTWKTCVLVSDGLPKVAMGLLCPESSVESISSANAL